MGRVRYSFTFICIYFSLGGLIGGYLLSIIAGSAGYILLDLSLTKSQLSTIMGLIIFGGLIAKGILLFNDRFGRRTIIVLNLLLFLVGTFLFSYAINYDMLFWGRLIQGTAAIMSTVTFTVYLGEVAPIKSRGAVITLFQLSWTSGILLASIINFSFGNTGNWRLMFVLITLIPILLIVLTPFLPESPMGYLKAGDKLSASKLISMMNNYKLTPMQVSDELKVYEGSAKKKSGSSLQIVLKYKKNIILATTILVLTQLCGINAIIQTIDIILKDCGIESKITSSLALILIALINFIMTIFTMVYIDKIGRRRVLKIGIVGFGVSMLFLVIALLLFSKGSLLGGLSLLFILIGIAFLAFGPTGAVYVVVTELLPTSVRTNGFVIGGFVATFIGALFVSNFLVIALKFGYSSLFGLITFVAIFYFVFIKYFLPETAGKSLTQLEG